MVTSNEILSPHFVRDKDSYTAKKIPAEDINSMKSIPLTVTSWPRNLDMPEMPHIVGHDGARMPTNYIWEAVQSTASNSNRWRVPIQDLMEYGPFSPQIDDVQGFKSWLDAGTKYGTSYFDYAKVPQKTDSSGVIVGFSEKRANFDIRDTAMPKYTTDIEVVNWHNNKVGYAVSQAENAKQGVMRYLRTEDAQELIPFLRSLDYSPKNIGQIAVGFLPKDAIYGVDEIDGKVTLFVAEDAYDKIAKWARAYGLDAEDIRNFAFSEELTHIYRGTEVDNLKELLKEETATKQIKLKHYQRLERGAEGNPNNPKVGNKRGKYTKLKHAAEDDLRTVFRYKDLYLKDKHSLEMVLELEAIEQGYEGRDVKEYVANRVREIGDKVDKNSKMSRLEKIAENDGKANPDEVEAKEPSEAPS